MKRKWLAAICICMMALTLAGCGIGREGTNTADGMNVSIVSVLTFPDRHDGQRCAIRARLYAGETGLALYPSEYDIDEPDHINGIWLGKYEEVGCLSKEEAKALHGQYVTVRGTVQAGKKGPGEGYNCEMDTITSITKLEQVNPKRDWDKSTLQDEAVG